MLQFIYGDFIQVVSLTRWQSEDFWKFILIRSSLVFRYEDVVVFGLVQHGCASNRVVRHCGLGTEPMWKLEEASDEQQHEDYDGRPGTAVETGTDGFTFKEHL